MRDNAYRTLRITLAAAIVLLLFCQVTYPARTQSRKGTNSHHSSRKQKASRQRSLPTVKQKQPESTTPEAQAKPSTFGIPKLDDIEIRSDGEVVAFLGQKDRFEIVERDGDYFKVKLSDGRTGSVIADLVKIEETRKAAPISDTYGFRNSIVRTAYSYRGSRYRRGGVSARGFDCSGFMMFLYAKQGVRLPHSSRAQYGCGKAVSKGSLLPGDLVFFAGTYRRGISHVGMYIGEGRFIHASTSRGGVRVDDLDAAYYRRRYAGARRIKS